MLEIGSNRSFHLFDSFEGLSGPTEQDAFRPDIANWSKGDLTASEDIAAKNLADFSNVSFHRGWIPSRFGEVADLTFALLHVDVDLYAPTMESMRFFWPRLAPGGLVVCDDYGSVRCPGARAAIDEFVASEKTGRFWNSLRSGPDLQRVLTPVERQAVDRSRECRIAGRPVRLADMCPDFDRAGARATTAECRQARPVYRGLGKACWQGGSPMAAIGSSEPVKRARPSA